jgi:hypothetical protein
MGSVLSRVWGRAGRGALAFAGAVALSIPPLAFGGAYRPLHRVSDAGDQSTAYLVVVRRSDLPGSGWRSVRLQTAGSWFEGVARRTNVAPSCRKVDLDASHFIQTAFASSPFFVNQQAGAYLGSTTEVLSTAAQARAYFGRRLSEAALRCTIELSLDGMKSTGARPGDNAKIKLVGVKQLTPRPKVDALLGLRVIGRLTRPGGTVTTVVDTFALRQNRTIAEIDFGGIGGAPSEQFEQQVLTKVAARLRAAKG